MKKFINPELELIELEEKDIITASGEILFDESEPTTIHGENSPAKSTNWTNLVWNTNQ